MSSLEEENRTIRDEFNIQRAKLKELFLQKEGLTVVGGVGARSGADVIALSGECNKLQGQLKVLRQELNEAKSQVVVAEYKRETEIQHQDRRAQQEIASLQHLVHGRIACGQFDSVFIR